MDFEERHKLYEYRGELEKKLLLAAHAYKDAYESHSQDIPRIQAELAKAAVEYAEATEYSPFCKYAKRPPCATTV